MKLRIRSLTKKETIRVEASNTSSLLDLKTLIASKLSSSFTTILPESIHLSLNGTFEVIASSPGESIAAIGFVSGDLLFYSLEPGFFLPHPNLPSESVADDMDVKVEPEEFLQEKVKINGNMRSNAVDATPIGSGVSSQKRAKPSIHGEPNSVKTVWKKAKAVSFGGASVCRSSVSPAKSSSQDKATPSSILLDNGPLQSGKGVATSGIPPSSRTPEVLAEDLPPRTKELSPSPPHRRSSVIQHLLQSFNGRDANSGTPPSSRTPGILCDDLPKELSPQPPLGRLSHDHVTAGSVSPTKSSSQGEATLLVNPQDKGPMELSNGKDVVTPGILSDDLSVTNVERSNELSPPPSFGRWSFDHIASISVGSALQGKETPSVVTPCVKLPLRSCEAGETPPNSHTPGIVSDKLQSGSEARSKEVPLPPFGRWPYDHVGAISAPISGPTAIGDLQSRLAAYVADMEARMRVVELSNLSSRITALEARMGLVEGYGPRLQIAEERCSEIGSMRVQISEIRRQVDHLVTHSTGTSSEQALAQELVRQGKQHLAQAEALFQTATTLAYTTRKHTWRRNSSNTNQDRSLAILMGPYLISWPEEVCWLCHSAILGARFQNPLPRVLRKFVRDFIQFVGDVFYLLDTSACVSCYRGVVSAHRLRCCCTTLRLRV